MRTPTALRNLDDRVLRRRSRPSTAHDEVYPEDRTEAASRPRRPPGDVGREALGVVWRVARLLLLALAAVVALAVALTFLPTNDDNVIVSTVLDLGEWAAGPFRDVFTAETARRELLYNYALATGVYLLAAALVAKLGAKLPGRRGAAG